MRPCVRVAAATAAAAVATALPLNCVSGGGVYRLCTQAAATRCGPDGFGGGVVLQGHTPSTVYAFLCARARLYTRRSTAPVRRSPEKIGHLLPCQHVFHFSSASFNVCYLYFRYSPLPSVPLHAISMQKTRKVNYNKSCRNFPVLLLATYRKTWINHA